MGNEVPFPLVVVPDLALRNCWSHRPLVEGACQPFWFWIRRMGCIIVPLHHPIALVSNFGRCDEFLVQFLLTFMWELFPLLWVMLTPIAGVPWLGEKPGQPRLFPREWIKQAWLGYMRVLMEVHRKIHKCLPDLLIRLLLLCLSPKSSVISEDSCLFLLYMKSAKASCFVGAGEGE